MIMSFELYLTRALKKLKRKDLLILFAQTFNNGCNSRIVKLRHQLLFVGSGIVISNMVNVRFVFEVVFVS